MRRQNGIAPSSRAIPLLGENGEIVEWFGAASDITARKEAEEALRDSEDRLNFALEVSQIGAWDLDLLDSTARCSAEYARIFGDQSLPPAWNFEMFLEHVLPEDRGTVIQQVRQAVDAQGDYSFECRIRRHDGEVRWIWVAGRHRLDRNGKPRRRAEIVQDITDRRNTEEATLQAIPDLLFEVDRKGRIHRLHAADETQLYRPPRELLGRTVGEVLPRDSAHVILTALAEADQKGWHRGATHSLTLPAGEHWFELSIATKPETRGIGRRFIILSRDITQRKRAQDALRESEERFRVALATAPVTVFHQDQDLRYTWVGNPRLGIPGEAILGRTDEDLFGAEVAAPLTALKRRVLESGRGERQEVSVTYQGRTDCLELMVEPLRNASGQVVGVTGAAFDITEQKRSALALAEAKEAAEAANRTKSQFLANISHELRTPLHAVLGMIELTLREKLPPSVQARLQLANRSAEVLLELLNQILDFSRMEAGKITLEEAAFNLRITLDETMKTLGVRAEQKGLELCWDLPRDVPTHLIGDSLRLRQIVTDLAGNAIKFTERGEVVVRGAVESRTAETVVLRFSVTDTGIGISPEDQRKIFTAFSQVDASTTRRYGGSGLGLAIASTLVQLLGGRLGVDSVPGRGSTFFFTATFRLPSEAAEPAPLEAAFLEQVRDLPVLVVNGHATNRQILCDTLTAWSLKPVAADGVQMALAQARQAAAGRRPFPLVIVDPDLAEGDGWELIRELRKQRRRRVATILLVSAANHQALAKRRPHAATAAYLIKPVGQGELLRAIVRGLGLVSTPGRRPTSPALPVTPPRSLRILLAEDAPAGRLFATEVLQERGHTVQTAEDGRTALALVQAHDFDVVLMDVQMPELDGFQTAAAIRALPEPTKSRVPIVAITAHAKREDERQCLAAGMNAYLSKPIKSATLIDMVERLAEKAWA